MFNPRYLIQTQKQQQKEQKRQARRQQQKLAEKQAVEKERMKTFEKLMQGKVCTKEELETMQMKHQMYKEHGHYISVFEKDSKGFNLQAKEFEDFQYIPIPQMMAEIKILKGKQSFIRDVPTKEEMSPLDQKYFQSIVLKYCFTEIRKSIRMKHEYNRDAVQKLILGKYSFERYVNYQQRLFVTSKDRKMFVIENIDVSVVPVPKFPVIQMIHEEKVEEKVEEIIQPRSTMIIHPIGAYSNPMDYYINVIQWCRHCAHYNNCPEALCEAILELMGNEGKYKEVFSDPTEMLKFVDRFARRYQYFAKGFGGKERYADVMIDYIAENGRFEIMRKVSRMLGHWGLSQEVKTNAYLALKNNARVTHDQIREMYLDPRKLAIWLKAFIPDSYTTEDVDAAMTRHGFYYY